MVLQETSPNIFPILDRNYALSWFHLCAVGKQCPQPSNSSRRRASGVDPDVTWYGLRTVRTL